MIYDHIRVDPLATHLGAEISASIWQGQCPTGGLDRDPRGVRRIRGRVLPQPAADARGASRLCALFWSDRRQPLLAAVPGYPMIAEVRKEPEQQRNIGNGWHTDHCYDEALAFGSMLYAREVPKTGGDTLFASMYAAYDALSDGLNRPSKG